MTAFVPPTALKTRIGQADMPVQGHELILP